MRWPGSWVAAVLVLGIAGSSAAGQVHLAIHDGLVTLDAKDATLREIFAEWARVGQTRVVNGETVIGGPVTLQMTDVPERRALETLLRPVAGFIAATRPVPQPSLSTYDRILVMPGVRPTVVPAAAAATSSPGVFQFTSPTQAARDRMAASPIMINGDQEQPDQGAPMQAPFGTPGQRSGLTGGSPYTPAGGQVGTTPGQPTAPASTTRPGMPTAPAQPIKGPGGLE